MRYRSMRRLVRGGLSAALASLVLLSSSAAQPVYAGVQTPEEEDVIDAVFPTVPSLLPTLIDLGQVNATVEQYVPALIDEWPVIDIGGCLLDVNAPTGPHNGVRVKGSAGWACGGNQASMTLVVCLQIREANKWQIIEGSCRMKKAADEDVIYKRTSALCRPGTWNYRTIAAAEATGYNASEKLASGKSGAVQIVCHPGGI